MEHYYQREIETAPREQIRKLQNERLLATVRRVYERVPLYRERMQAAGVSPDDIQSIDDLKKLPFTYKQDLRDAQTLQQKILGVVKEIPDTTKICQ